MPLRYFSVIYTSKKILRENDNDINRIEYLNRFLSIQFDNSIVCIKSLQMVALK